MKAPIYPDSRTIWRIPRLEYLTKVNQIARAWFADLNMDYPRQPEDEETAAIAHRASVFKAFYDGEAISNKVLRDYPDLRKGKT